MGNVGIRAFVARLFGGSGERNADPVAAVDVSGLDHDALLQRGTDLITPHIFIEGRKTAARNDANVRSGIACLDRVLELNPSNWAAFWFRGKAFQSLGEHRNAVEAFRAAYRLKSDQPDVAREFAAELLETQAFGEALMIGRDLASRFPQDAGLQANLALALLLSGDLPAAQQSIIEALRLAPNDAISNMLAKRIGEFANGSRRMPKSLADLQRQK
jgi:tetratricopeptide (TPR) repeat protein